MTVAINPDTGDDTVYGASPIKRSRRTKTEVETLDIAIYEIVREYKPVTVRQAYYLLVSAGAINKTEAEY